MNDTGAGAAEVPRGALADTVLERLTATYSTAADRRGRGRDRENRSTRYGASARIDVMFRYAFLVAASAAADAPKAAVRLLAAAVDGARS